MARDRVVRWSIALGATLVLSAVVGFVLSRTGTGSQDGVAVLDDPAGIPTAPALTGEPLPDLSVQTLGGESVALRSFLGERPLVVNLWFSSCVPCRKELPDFAAVHGELGDRVRFVGLNLQDTAERAAEFAAAAGVTYELVLDPEQRIAIELDVLNFPSTLFVDTEGTIVELRQGALSADELRSTIDAMLLP
jgi:thiol-disulfide isomerase/thioredoxin